MNVLVSIVVPVYNVKDYLEEAVHSVMNQTYRNTEIILVDDGSTDGSGEICDRLKEKDGRIIVIHDKNEGLSEARNRGIRIAGGEYICFLDSDDYLDAEFVRKMLYSIKKTGADMAVCPVWKVYMDGTITGPKPVRRYQELNTDETYRLMFSQNGHIGIYAVNKLYKTSLFQEVSYPYGKYYEDSGTTYKLVNLCDKTVFYQEPLYYYRVDRPGSIVSDKSKLIRRFDKCDFFEEMDRFFRKKDKSVQQAFYVKYMTDLMAILEDCAMQSMIGSGLWLRARELFLRHKDQLFYNRLLPAGRKAKGISLLVSEHLFVFFCRSKKVFYSSTSFRGYDA